MEDGGRRIVSTVEKVARLCIINSAIGIRRRLMYLSVSPGTNEIAVRTRVALRSI